MDGSIIDSWTSFRFSNEADFEKIILQKNVFKDQTILDMKVSLNKSGYYNRYADVVIFSKDFNFWSIGEIEIAEHSFINHVFPQLIELFSLIEKNLSEIQSEFLAQPVVASSKDLQDLIRFNKPFLTLIIDRFPLKYVSAINLLKQFCNVHVVSRYKDQNENYIYAIEDHLMYDIEFSSSNCTVKDNVLLVERPNLLGMHKSGNIKVWYEGGPIKAIAYEALIGGQNRLFWMLDTTTIRSGLYRLSIKENKLNLTKP